MSNQGYSPPQKKKTATDKVLDTIFWPVKKTFEVLTVRVLSKFRSKK